MKTTNSDVSDTENSDGMQCCKSVENKHEIEGYFVSKNFDRFFLIFILVGGIGLFVVLPIISLFINEWTKHKNHIKN